MEFSLNKKLWFYKQKLYSKNEKKEREFQES